MYTFCCLHSMVRPNVLTDLGKRLGGGVERLLTATLKHLPLAWCSATLVGRSIIVLGGTGSRVWSLKEVTPPFHPIAFTGTLSLVDANQAFSADACSCKIWMAGWMPTTATKSLQVYSLDIDTWLWKEHTADVVGDVPPPRCGHTVVALPGDRYLLVFGGGIPEQDTFFGTASVLDTYTWLWSNPLITVRLQTFLPHSINNQLNL